MLLFFAIFITSKVDHPVYFVPGLFSSNLTLTYNNYAKHYYCPKSLNQEFVWPNPKYQNSPTLSNCLVDFLAQNYDPITNTLSDLPGVVWKAGEIGESHTSVICQLIDYFFKQHGYTNDNFKSVPYDWRLAVSSHFLEGGLFSRLKASIEETYTINSNTPVVMIGYSLGTLISHTFLMQYCDEEWRQKYIFRIIFQCPAICGASIATLSFFYNLLIKSSLPYVSNDLLSKLPSRIPSLINLFPNYEVFTDPIIYGPNSQVFTAKNVSKALEYSTAYRNNAFKIFKTIEPYISNGPQDPKIPTLVIYNSVIPTVYSMSLSKTWEFQDVQYQGGDSTVPKVGPEWLCKNWENIQCYDLHCSDLNTCDHGNSIYQPTTLALFYNFTTEEPIYI